MATKVSDSSSKQPITVKVMEDEDFINHLLVRGEKPREVKKLWHRLRKIRSKN